MSASLLPRTGDILSDRFELLRLAGSGGMAAVWYARDRKRGARIALKVLLAPNEAQMARFLQEASILEALDHPGIVRHVDHGVTEEGHGYLAMEWLSGEDLSTRLKRGPLGVEEAVALLGQLTEILAAVHARGFIHRDLKPGNIFLVDSDLERIKLIDFGIARLTDDAFRLTNTGVSFGTPPYMAPEQIRGERDVGPAADVYSLGCVLFECLTGNPPFVAAHPMGVMAKALFDEAPRLREACPEIPEALDALAARLLSKDVARRPAHAGALGRELCALGAKPEAAAASVEPAPRSLTATELRLVSVVLASAQPGPRRLRCALATSYRVRRSLETTLESPAFPRLDASSRVAALAAFAERCGARIEPLPDDAVIAVVAGAHSPTDMAGIAAGLALQIRALWPEARVSLATGWDVMAGAQPLGRVIDRADALLAEGAEDASLLEAHVLLDAMTAALIGERFAVASDGPRHTLIGEREVAEETRHLLGKATTCVVRNRELRLLEELFDECVEEPATRVSLVTAAAGVGKSRLCHELLRRLRARDAPASIWIARGDPMAMGAPFGLLRRLVRREARLLDGEARDVQWQKLGAWAARRVDAESRKRVTEFLGEMVGVPFPDDESVELRAARHEPMLMGDQIRRAWVDLLDAETRAQPVLLVLEDLHWGDQPTLECVNAALRLLGDRPLMVLALARPEAREAFPGLWADREATEIRLGELSRKACRELARQVLDPPIADEGVQAIVERSAGNAFFLEELLRAAAEGQKGEVPATVLAVMQARLADLDVEARRALRAASIFGQVFWRGALGALLGDAASAGHLDGCLAELERRELITRLPASAFHGEAEYGFRQALVREAAYGMLTDEDRALGHRLSGAWLERAGASDATVLAAHAERGGEQERAAALYERAAAEALRGSDLDAALANVRRAVACGAAGEVLGSAMWIEAEIHNWRGDFVAGARAGSEAMRLLPCATSSWYAGAAAVAWAALALGDHAQLLWVASELTQQIPLSAPSTGQLIGVSRVLLGLYRAGMVRDATALFEVLIAAPEELRRVPMVTAHLEEVLAWRATCARDRVASYQGFLASAEGFERAGDARNYLRVATNAAMLRMLLGEYAEAERDLRAALVVSRRLGLENLTACMKENLGLALARQGALEEARLLETEAIAVFSAQGDQGQESAARSYLAEILKGLGQIEDAEREARQAVALAASVPGLRCYALAVLAEVLLARGFAPEALDQAERAMNLLTELGGIEEGEALVRLSLAEALHANEAIERAREAIYLARDSVLAVAASIDDPERRRRFLEHVPENARTLAHAERWLEI